jgi:hypothetical protein
MLNVVYWIEWWSARSVTNVESKFFKAEIDYHEKYDDWNNVLEYIQCDDDDEEEEKDDCL